MAELVSVAAEAGYDCIGLRLVPVAGQPYSHPLDAGEIERRLRAFDPQPGCHFELGGQTVKLWRARVSAGFGAAPGAVLTDGKTMRVACGDGQALELLELQRAGGRRLAVAAYLASP